jgi:hypothetical protein
VTLDALLKPVDESTTREFDWSELIWHLGLSGPERHGIHDLMQHWLLVWLFCNGEWDVLPLERADENAGAKP